MVYRYRTSSSMRDVGDVASTLRRQFGLPQYELVEALQEAWTETAGAALAQRCQQVEVRAGALRILTGDPAVAEALKWRERTLLVEMKKRLPELEISSLRVRVGTK